MHRLPYYYDYEHLTNLGVQLHRENHRCSDLNDYSSRIRLNYQEWNRRDSRVIFAALAAPMVRRDGRCSDRAVYLFDDDLFPKFCFKSIERASVVHLESKEAAQAQTEKDSLEVKIKYPCCRPVNLTLPSHLDA